MTPDERRQMRREQVEKCLASHMTIRDWCRLNKVPESTMYVWVRRFRDEEPESFGGPGASGWVEITREAVAARTALAKASREPAPDAHAEGPRREPSAIVVRLNGADVAVPPGADGADVSSVLRAVAAL